MDFDPDSGRRLLKALERIGEELEALYQGLPSLCERVAPDWEGDTAEHASEVFGRYATAKKTCLGQLERAENRLRNAVKTAEAIEQLFARRGGT